MTGAVAGVYEAAGKPVVPESFPGPGRMGVDVRCWESQRASVCGEDVLQGYVSGAPRAPLRAGTFQTAGGEGGGDQTQRPLYAVPNTFLAYR